MGNDPDVTDDRPTGVAGHVRRFGTRTGLVAPLVAATMAGIAVCLGWQGVDLPAQLYRVGLFHRSGLTLWDSQWYSGHWTLGYSVLFPPLAGVVGVQATEIGSAALAAWAFERLTVGHFGKAARVGSLLFAAGTLVQVAIGQLPFLLGEAFALTAICAATRRWWVVAVALGIATVLASPLAGTFLVLAVTAWLVASWPRPRLGLVLLGALPSVVVLALVLAFPGQGIMPFPFIDFAELAVPFVAVCALVPSHERALRLAAAFYVAATVVSFALPTPMGGNVSRLGECLGVPLLACVLWPHRRRLLALVVIPIGLLQWKPAFATFPADRRDPSTASAYFRPLLAFLDQHRDPLGRVEIVPTRLHWEAAYAAPTVALARGWERQLDTADNAIFYDRDALNPPSYLSWLRDEGVRYVALPDVALDFAAVNEGRLVQGGVPGLSEVWRDPHWRVFEVEGSPGIVDGPARLLRLDGDQAVLHVFAPGSVHVRLRYSSRWAVVAGHACLYPAADGWTTVQAVGEGDVRIQLRLLGADHDGC